MVLAHCPFYDHNHVQANAIIKVEFTSTKQQTIPFTDGETRFNYRVYRLIHKLLQGQGNNKTKATFRLLENQPLMT